jgi:hypothetical protein
VLGRADIPRQICSPYARLEPGHSGSPTSGSLRLRREGHDCRRARGDAAQRSGRLGRVLSRVWRPAVCNPSRGTGEQLAVSRGLLADRRVRAAQRGPSDARELRVCAWQHASFGIGRLSTASRWRVPSNLLGPAEGGNRGSLKSAARKPIPTSWPHTKRSRGGSSRVSPLRMTLSSKRRLNGFAASAPAAGASDSKSASANAPATASHRRAPLHRLPDRPSRPPRQFAASRLRLSAEVLRVHSARAVPLAAGLNLLSAVMTPPG